jgi:hypothetical protein
MAATIVILRIVVVVRDLAGSRIKTRETEAACGRFGLGVLPRHEAARVVWVWPVDRARDQVKRSNVAYEERARAAPLMG